MDGRLLSPSPPAGGDCRAGMLGQAKLARTEEEQLAIQEQLERVSTEARL
jgi:hypothetical protein